MTLTALGQALGLSQSAVSRLEKRAKATTARTFWRRQPHTSPYRRRWWASRTAAAGAGERRVRRHAPQDSSRRGRRSRGDFGPVSSSCR
ncbi:MULTISPECIES: hypothetical protein [Streptomyces]|uniref:hypothetical protein n=1 Tax=Streptomyces TaxID=1883 RepID=UPI001E558648|nr:MULTISPECIES: hypothetical protein [Streptomyces]